MIKFLLFLTLFSLLSSLFSPPAHAQTIGQEIAKSEEIIVTNQTSLPSSLQTLSSYNTGPHVASQAIYSFGHALSCILTGSSTISPCLEYRFTKNVQGVVSGTPYLSSVNTSGGLLGMGGSTLALLYQEKPLDQMSFFTYMGRNLGIVKEANAQVGGSGNQVLSPVFALWTVSRNVAYLVMILIFVIVGLMVMFRQKLNPQTIVSAQMALPGLVIGLVLITFSYFLAALITDIAYIGTDLVGYYFDEAIKINGGGPANAPLTERLALHNALTVGGRSTAILDQTSIEYFVTQFWNSLPPATDSQSVTQFTLLNPSSIVRLFSAGITYMLYNSFLSPISDLAGGAIGLIGSFLKSRGGSPITSAIGTIVGGAGTTVAAGAAAEAWRQPTSWLSFWGTILAVIILMYTIVRLVLKLLNNYLMIVFLTIASPFVFLASSIPGRQDLAVNWMRNMACNVLAFPAVIGVFYFAAYLVGNNPQLPGFGVTTPLNITNATGNLPFLGGLNLEFLRRILAFVAILATPSIPDIICRTVGKPGQSGGVLAGAIGGAISQGRSYEGQMSGQIQKAGSDVGSWRGALFGQRQYTGGRLGEYQERLTPDGKGVGTHIDGLGVWGNLANRIEGWRRNQATHVPQSSQGHTEVSDRAFKQTT